MWREIGTPVDHVDAEVVEEVLSFWLNDNDGTYGERLSIALLSDGNYLVIDEGWGCDAASEEQYLVSPENMIDLDEYCENVRKTMDRTNLYMGAAQLVYRGELVGEWHG